jgi:hypothetical protein
MTASTATFDASQHLGSLKLDAGARGFLSAAGQNVIVLDAVQIAPTGQLDLNDGNLILHASDGLAAQAALERLFALLKTGRNGGKWNGRGLNSSAAANNSAGNTGLMLLRNGDAGPPLSAFAGQPVDGNSILSRYALNGDLDLNGIVDADDYFQIDTGFADGLDGVSNGDLDLSGSAPDADDYFLIDQAAATQAELPAGGGFAKAALLRAATVLWSNTRPQRRRSRHHLLPPLRAD